MFVCLHGSEHDNESAPRVTRHMVIQLCSVIVCFDCVCSNQLLFEGDIHLTVTLSPQGDTHTHAHTLFSSVWQTIGYSLDTERDWGQRAAMLMLFDFLLLSPQNLFCSFIHITVSFLHSVLSILLHWNLQYQRPNSFNTPRTGTLLQLWHVCHRLNLYTLWCKYCVHQCVWRDAWCALCSWEYL